MNVLLIGIVLTAALLGGVQQPRKPAGDPDYPVGSNAVTQVVQGTP